MEPMVQRVLLALVHAKTGVAFETWVVPFHRKRDISYQNIGDSSLASYLWRKEKKCASMTSVV